MISTYLYIQKRRAKKDAERTGTDGAPAEPSLPSNPPASQEVAAGVSNVSNVNKEQCNVGLNNSTKEAEKKEKSKARSLTFRLVLGLFFPYFIASTDVTSTDPVIATALPFIANHFGQLDQLNWIVTAFTITSTSFIPVWGQLADVFGRHVVLQTVMVIMMIGAALAAGAQSWVMLLFGRALMGVAAAGILNIIKIVLADGVSLRENAKNNTIFSLVGGLSFGIGPVVGGYLTASSWRWCFILNIPIALISMVLTFLLLRKDLIGPAPCEANGRSGTFLAKISTVDYGGLFLFVGGITLIILGTTWGGATYPWNSVAVIVSIVLGGIMFFAFFFYEYLMEPGRILAKLLPSQQPMIPLQLFSKRDLSLLSWISFSTGSAMYSIFYFVGVYFTVVKGYPADQAGIQLLYYLPGIGVGVYLAMFFCNVWPKQTWFPLMGGSILETVGFAVLAWALHTERVSVIGGMMGLAGAGTGMRLMPETLHVTGIWPNQIARAMSVVDFCIPFGGTIALAMMGAVFNNKLVGQLQTGSSGTTKFDTQSESSLDAINSLPPAAQQAFRDTARNAVVLAFVVVLPIVALAIVAALFLGNVKISNDQKRTETGHLETREAVETRPFLWALISGRKPDASLSSEANDEAVEEKAA